MAKTHATDIVRARAIAREWDKVKTLLDEMRDSFRKITELMNEDGQESYEIKDVQNIAVMVRCALIGHVLRHMNHWRDSTDARIRMAKEGVSL